MTALRTGEVAAAAGVNVQTLRYYERRGLLPEPERTLGGHRAYPVDAPAVVRVIKAAQRLGFTLAEVAELLGSIRRRHDGVAGRGMRRRTEAKLHEVDEKIADLQLVRDRLRAALDAGCDDLVTCAETPECPLPLAELVDGSPDDRR